MNIKSKFLLSIMLIFLAITTKSICAEDVKHYSELDKAFILAVRSYDLEKIQKLIDAGADVNASIPDTYTSGDCDWNIQNPPLIFAIQNNQLEMVKMLLHVKNRLCTSLNEALKHAIRNNNSAIMEELIKAGADFNYVDENGNTLLIIAAMTASYVTAEKLIKAGVDINCVNANGDTPLIIATKNANPIAEFYRQAPARARSGWESKKTMIETLLKSGVDINHVNKHGKTALMEAIKNYDLNTVLDLLKFPELTKGWCFGFGEKPINHADEDGNTALIIAIKNIQTSYIEGHTEEYRTCLNSQKIVEALLKTPGIDPHHANKNGETAIALLEKLDNQMKYRWY